MNAPASRPKKRLLALLTVSSTLAACSSLPTGPSVMTLPGSGHTLNSFRADDSWCRDEALRLIGGQSVESRSREAAAGSAAVGTAIGAVAGAAIGGRDAAAVGAGVGLLAGAASGGEQARLSGYSAQRQYDQAYIQCMYARGHRVPLPAESARSLQRLAQPVAGGYVQSPARSAAELGIPPPPAGPPPAAPPPPTRSPAPPAR